MAGLAAHVLTSIKRWAGVSLPSSSISSWQQPTDDSNRDISVRGAHRSMQCAGLVACRAGGVQGVSRAASRLIHTSRWRRQAPMRPAMEQTRSSDEHAMTPLASAKRPIVTRSAIATPRAARHNGMISQFSMVKVWTREVMLWRTVVRSRSLQFPET